MNSNVVDSNNLVRQFEGVKIINKAKASAKGFNRRLLDVAKNKLLQDTVLMTKKLLSYSIVN